MLNISRSKKFLYCCLAFIIGIFVASFLPTHLIKNDLWWFAGMAGSLILLILLWKNNSLFAGRFSALFLLIFFLALWRYSLALPVNGSEKVWFYNGQKAIITGKVAEEPDVRESNVKYILAAQNIETKNGKPRPLKVEGRIFVSSVLFPAYNFGDQLEIECQLKTPDRIEDFDFGRYLAKSDIYSACYYPKIRFIGNKTEGVSSRFYSAIFKFKNISREIINRGLNEPEAALANGMVLGDQRALPKDLQNKFAQTGLSHIVAISGMNITIISVFLIEILLLLGFWRRQTFYAANMVIFIYIILIGASISAVRAGVMSFLFLLAIHLGRQSKLVNVLVLSASVMLFFNPKLLRDDIGFQLSFLSILGLIYLYPALTQWSIKLKVPAMKGVRELINMTLAAQLFTTPIIIYNFSLISIVSPLANVLTLWSLAPLMVLIFSALGASFLLSGLVGWLFLPTQILLKYLVYVVNITANLPLSNFTVDSVWWGWLAIFYILIFYFINLSNKFFNKEAVDGLTLIDEGIIALGR